MGQNQDKIDSLRGIINSTTYDTVKIDNLLLLGEVYYYNYVDSAKLIWEESRKLAEDINYEVGMADSYNNLAFIYDYMGDMTNSLKYYFKTIPLDEKNKNYTGMAITLGNIGLIYVGFRDYDKAKKYYLKSLKLLKKYPNPRQLARTYSHLGYLQSVELNEDSAKYYYNLSLQLSLEHKLPEIANAYNNLAKVYFKNGDLDSSYILQQKCLEYAEIYQNWDIMIYSFCNIGIMEQEKGNYQEAKNYFLRAYDIVEKMHVYPEKGKCLGLLSEVNELMGDYKTSLIQFKEMTKINDSIFNQSKSIEIGKLEAGFEYEKQKVLDDAINEKLLAVEKEEKEKKTVIVYATSFSIVLLMIFLLFVFNRLRITKQQKLVIEEQKEIVDLKNKEITDSIRYAKRIQSAILPQDNIVKAYLPDSFVLYKPKDIVAGDFYWMEVINKQEISGFDPETHPKEKIPQQVREHDLILFAAADCTGHGVPGAMVSVVCNNGLNRSVREYGITEPGKILDKTREIVIHEFEKSLEDVKDGMDIALCSLELPSREEAGGVIKYAGAHNPLWIIRNGELLETKANKQPIGRFDNAKPYTTHTFNLEKGDAVYIFSDGYVDQFGGKNGKKFKPKGLRELLLNIQDKSMEEQKVILNENFENWKGSLAQVDDVCFIGLRV